MVRRYNTHTHTHNFFSYIDDKSYLSYIINEILSTTDTGNKFGYICVDSLGEFTTRSATEIHSIVLGSSYNKYVRPHAITNISIELVLFSLDELVSFYILTIFRSIICTCMYMTVYIKKVNSFVQITI